MKLDRSFIIGTIIGGLLAILGAFIQSRLYEKYDKEKKQTELMVNICNHLNTRIYLAKNIITASSSSVFSDRWDRYINEGVIPWNINKPINKYILSKRDSLIYKRFKFIDDKFISLHNTLVELRKVQGAVDSITIKKGNGFVARANLLNNEIENEAVVLEEDLLN